MPSKKQVSEGLSVIPHEGAAYLKLVDMIKERHPCDDQTAHRLARNLMGYTELVLRIDQKNKKKRSKKKET